MEQLTGDGTADDRMELRHLVQARPHERQIAWQSLGFTVFIHYGINTFSAADGVEWGHGSETGIYNGSRVHGAHTIHNQHPSNYQPSNLSTDQWCQAIVAAGAKGVIITAKHHDGFCMWHTATTKYSVQYANAPYNAVDIVKELSKSCTKYGLKMGIYLSNADGNAMQFGSTLIPTEQYNDFYLAQIRELLSGGYGNYGEYREDGNYDGRYGEIFSFWIDGAQGHVDASFRPAYDFAAFYTLIRDLQPMAAISISGPDVAWVGNEEGKVPETQWSVLPSKLADPLYIQSISQADVNTPPCNITDANLGSRGYMREYSSFMWYPCEADVSIRPGWFFHSSENPKPLAALQDMYEKTVGGNVNWLLNVPPNREGRFNANDVARLSELGNWIKNIYDDNLLNVPGVAVSAAGTGDSEPGCPVENILNDDESYWRPAGERETARIIITLPAATDITHVVLQEQIRHSQRIESFSIDVQNAAGVWASGVYIGTTVGFKKICRFSKRTAAALRINITESRLFPTLRYVAVHLDKN